LSSKSIVQVLPVYEVALSEGNKAKCTTHARLMLKMVQVLFRLRPM
jgi:hypothetical protein